MVSTYIDFSFITRDMNASLNRVATQKLVAREADYYKENIGKVTTLDEFLGDYRLYSYAMKAYGLEEMTYAKAFMRKVLESDLNDDQSYANRLTDDRYLKFAQAFNFSSGTVVAQTGSQMDELIGLYTANVNGISDKLNDESYYYNAVIDTVTSADQLLSNERLRNYATKAFGIDPKYASYSHLKQILTSDLDDPASYVYTLNSQSALTFALAFNFGTDGTLASGVLPQNDAQKTITNENYVLNGSSRVTTAAALLNQTYYEQTIGSITSIADLKSNTRLFNYVVTAFGLPSSTLTSTVENILTSDPDDPASYVNTQGGARNSAYKALRAAFNFQADGTLASGDAVQTAAQMATTSQGYMVHYNDKDDAADETLINSYKTLIGTMINVDDFLKTTNVLKLALTAFDLQNEGDTVRKLKKVLTSDLNDPKSYVYTLRDTRYLDFAKAFNFNTDGSIGAPMLAQSESEILNTSKNYVLEKSRFGTDEEKTKAKEEASYYSGEIEKIDTLDDLLSNRRLVDFFLIAAGIDPKEVTTQTVRDMFTSDPDDRRSALNTTSDRRWKQIVSSFNFTQKGDVERLTTINIQTKRGVLEANELYLQQTLEEQSGEDNPGVRLALYFERMAPTVGSAYDLLGDPALLQVMQTTFDIPTEMSSADVDIQYAYLNRVLDVKDLHDPEKLKKLLERFTSLYDLANNVDVSPAALILGGSGGAISADTLFTLSQLRLGGG
ncbi:DUF1217 domain-containing protein [Ensifer soli]|uniref:DUF1217 domain-containing protein n=1 Tax=Ciceribacter sp. sgz301302 TaxID=3342379 RepID=UPI0035B7B32A